jgi:hypothetical protein
MSEYRENKVIPMFYTSKMKGFVKTASKVVTNGSEPLSGNVTFEVNGKSVEIDHCESEGDFSKKLTEALEMVESDITVSRSTSDCSYGVKYSIALFGV